MLLMENLTLVFNVMKIKVDLYLNIMLVELEEIQESRVKLIDPLIKFIIFLNVIIEKINNIISFYINLLI
jgi:hypothetical protein